MTTPAIKEFLVEYHTKQLEIWRTHDTWLRQSLEENDLRIAEHERALAELAGAGKEDA